MNSFPDPLGRLLRPRQIAVIGGREAAEVVRQSERMGYAGEIWPVNPKRAELAGRATYASIEQLPSAPDASFIAVPPEATIAAVRALAARGAGGAVCYASGFAEEGEVGKALQRDLVQAAGAVALVGPNCYGLLNYLDGAALWPDQHGGSRVERGVALITQSGNLGLTLTMQRRSLPLAFLITIGNQAVLKLPDYIAALSADPRVSAIGLHLEGIDDPAAFGRVAIAALGRGVPLVALKAGRSSLGAAAALSHTSTLVGEERLYTALFERVGVARVTNLAELIETLKLLHVCGPLAGRGIASISCSGGEAAMVADLAEPLGLELPPLIAEQRLRLGAVLGPRVALANPLDYHTYIWGDGVRQRACFATIMAGSQDITLGVLDFPTPEHCAIDAWETAADAFAGARGDAGNPPAAIVSALSECLPEAQREGLLAKGIAPMQGLAECLTAVDAAASIGAARRADLQPPLAATRLAEGAPRNLDEWAAKRVLAEHGLGIPQGRVVTPADAATAADALGYPLVLKALGEKLLHKSELGAVRLGLGSRAAVEDAAHELGALSDRLLLERMVDDPVAELIVGVSRDPIFGLVLAVGAGGVLVELAGDACTLLLPVTREAVDEALGRLRVARLIDGYRGAPRGDRNAVIDAVLAVSRYAEQASERLIELDINPLLVRPEGRGAVAADALLRIADA